MPFVPMGLAGANHSGRRAWDSIDPFHRSIDQHAAACWCGVVRSEWLKQSPRFHKLLITTPLVIQSPGAPPPTHLTHPKQARKAGVAAAAAAANCGGGAAWGGRLQPPPRTRARCWRRPHQQQPLCQARQQQW